MRLKLLLASLVLLVVFPTACTTPNCGDYDWQDITWQLESYGPVKNPVPIVIGSVITIQFDSAALKINGSGGCNSYFGGYTVDSNCGLKISGIGATKKACADNSIMQQEQSYFNALSNASKVEVTKTELRIICGEEILVYTR